MNQITRRQALKTTAAATVAFSAAPAIVRASSLKDDIRIAVIGTGGRGGAHINGFTSAKGSQVVALCDADEKVVSRRVTELEKKTGRKIDKAIDYREILDRDDIDAVSIASPNHWHALMSIHGCEAGKHVYVEKPVCHTIWEGRQMVNAMKKYKKVVAAGFQNRSDVGLRKAMPLIHKEEYGPIQMARGLCYRNRGSIGKRDTPLEIPSEVNYDLWLGPAADQPIMRPRLHYDWHWDFNTGNGDMGNQGPHEMDLLRWALGDPQHPAEIMSFGSRFAWNDAGNTPNMQCALFNFGDEIPVIFEVRNLHQKEKDKKNVGKYGRGPGVGIIITCKDGEFRGGRGGGAFYDKNGKEIQKFKGDAGKTHMQNFVDAVVSGDASKLRSPVESAFYSSSMSHLANISVRVGKTMSQSELHDELGYNGLASEVVDRFGKQLKLWNVDTKKTPWNLGTELTFDSKTEKFTAGQNLEAANALVRRKDRKPYVVPEIG